MKRLYIEFGGMHIRKFGLWIPDGAHLWWKGRGVHLFWHSPIAASEELSKHKRVIFDTDPTWNK